MRSAVCGSGVETEVGAKTLFATHYHELTTLAEHLERVHNVHVAADESDGDVTFLRTVRDGPTDRSYGIHIADLAGVPEPVVDRSRDVLTKLREEKAVEARGDAGGESVQAVFDVGSGEFVSDDAGSSDERVATDGSRAEAPASDPEDRALDPAAESVLDDLISLDVNETPPVELLGKVQDWQDELED